jgi:hypothetical protein
MLRCHSRRGAAAIWLMLVATACSTSAGPSTTVGSTAASTTTVSDNLAASSTVPRAPANTVPETTVPTVPPARLADVLVEPIDAARLADHLSTSVAIAADESMPDSARAAAGTEMQLALRWLAERPELDDQVLTLVSPTTIGSIRRMIEARQFAAAIRATKTNPAPPSDQLPAWTIVEPEPIESLLGYYSEAETATSVAWYWLAAIHLQETRLGRIVGVSSAGAVGPMQFLPSTWQQCCVGDPLVTRDAIIGAATYLAQSGAPDDMRAALYQYNPNVSYVVAVTAIAENLRDAPELFAGYYGWQVYFASSAGDVRLPVDYSSSAPISAVEYVRQHPEDLGD